MPSPPEIIVVGSGRCGTQSVAKLLTDAGIENGHEVNTDPTLMLAQYWAHGRITNPELVVGELERFEWPRVLVDFAFTPLVEVVWDHWPNTRFVQLIRHPHNTIASMVNRQWYRRSDDTIAPVYHLWMTEERERGLVRHTQANYWGLRVRGSEATWGGVDKVTWHEWGPIERCAWWWRWSIRSVARVAKMGETERMRWHRIEQSFEIPTSFGLNPHEHPFPNVGAQEVNPWSIPNLWQDLVEPTAQQLGYVVEQRHEFDTRMEAEANK